MNSYKNCETGRTAGVFFTSTVAFGAVVVLVNLRIVPEMVSLTWLHLGSVALSIFAYFLGVFVITLFSPFNMDMVGIVTEVYSSPIAWLSMIIAVMAPLLTDLAMDSFEREMRPKLLHVLQEREQMSHSKRMSLPQITFRRAASIGDRSELPSAFSSQFSITERSNSFATEDASKEQALSRSVIIPVRSGAKATATTQHQDPTLSAKPAGKNRRHTVVRQHRRPTRVHRVIATLLRYYAQTRTNESQPMH